jgi:hypothetical protein
VVLVAAACVEDAVPAPEPPQAVRSATRTRNIVSLNIRFCY